MYTAVYCRIWFIVYCAYAASNSNAAYRLKEMHKDIHRRRDALYVLKVCQRLSSKREVPEVVAWLEGLGAELLTVRLYTQPASLCISSGLWPGAWEKRCDSACGWSLPALRVFWCVPRLQLTSCGPLFVVRCMPRVQLTSCVFCACLVCSSLREEPGFCSVCASCAAHFVWSSFFCASVTLNGSRVVSHWNKNPSYKES